MRTTSRGWSLSAKLTAAYSILILIVCAILVGSVYWRFSTEQRRLVRERLVGLLERAAATIDRDYHADIQTPQNEKSPAYFAVLSSLNTIKEANEAVLHIYTLRQLEDGRIVYVVDYAPVAEERAHVGDVYDASPRLLQSIRQLGPMTEDHFTSGEDGVFLNGYAPLYDEQNALNGILVISYDASTIVTSERQILQAALTALVPTVLVSLLIGLFLARRMTSPVDDLMSGAQRIAHGHFEQAVPVRSRDELGVLADTFNAMQAGLRESNLRLEEYARTLEQQVAERTREVERRAAQIAAGAEIARVAVTLLDPDQLINQVVQLIQERFDYYYVGLFLVDAEGRYAVLQYGLGSGSAHEAGHIMKERGHKLEIGGQSMIGWTCANQRARIALDVGEDAVRFANPLTPETRSEMALPLRAGERVIGALSVQSTQEAAFDQEDIAALQGMADLIAVALENARLFQQTQQAMHELDEANRLLVYRGWQEYLAGQEVRQAEFRTAGLRTTSGALPHLLRIPLALGELALGTLTLERGQAERPWTEEEVSVINAIVRQAMLAVDNARLFESSRRLAMRERLINEITARIRSSTTIEGVLNLAIREISGITGAHYAAIDLEVAETE